MHRSSPIRLGASQAAARRRGFTLLELMLVLAIMVIIGSMMTPMLGDIFERQKLRGGAEQIRLKWDEARLKAMRTGQAQVFTCVIGSGNYTIQPLVVQSDATNAGIGTTLATAGGLVETQDFGYGTTAVAAPVDDRSETLEDNITFVSCLVATNMRSYTVAQEAQSTGSNAVNTQTVAETVIFYPDGSTSTAELQLQNERGDIRAVQLRGLTGYSRVVDISSVPSTAKDS